MTIANSIIDALGPLVCFGASFTRDHNVVDDSSLRDAVRNPLIGPLQDNGGVTNTHAIAANSPAVDAGANCSGADQRGQLRRRACDAGAYEFQGTPTPPSGGGQPPPPPPDEELPDPVPHKNVNAVPESGTVKIKLPGSDKFVELTEGQQIPLGTTVDARKGRVAIVAASGNGQTADFYAGDLQAQPDQGRQADHGPHARGEAHVLEVKASAAAKKKKKRRLWGDGKGRFRTKGKHSAATVSARSGSSRTGAHRR